MTDQIGGFAEQKFWKTEQILINFHDQIFGEVGANMDQKCS